MIIMLKKNNEAVWQAVCAAILIDVFVPANLIDCTEALVVLILRQLVHYVHSREETRPLKTLSFL